MPCLTACLLHRQLTPTVDVGTPPASGSSLLDTSGIFTGDSNPEDQKLFIVEKRCFYNLCEGLVKHCTCKSSPCWKVASFIQVRL
eukprot:Em0004g757a